ncbi:MAG: type II toxin-antitoxin system prevent-host-death family antitoxin [Solirubrobacterales bacterium]|nr:type II toxin-antitoxin system prevent-host-death family antitoxin [Solirubrobacterales bacterium]
MGKPVAIGEAKTNLSKLVEKAERGEEVVIRRGSKPVAKLIRYERPDRVLFGALKGKIKIGEGFEDPLSEFDEYR